MTDTTTATETTETETDKSEDTTDWKAKAREWERRAKENKTAADQLAALQDSQKTSEQRFEERISEMEKRAADAEAKALKSEIASKFGISAEDRDLFLTGSDEDTLTAQAQRLAARESDRKKQGNVAPKEGSTQTSGNSQEQATKDFLSELHGAVAD